MMILSLRFSAVWILIHLNSAFAALNLDGTQAVDPLQDGDPSPIGDLTTYYPDQHDCPLLCTDYGNLHSWTLYHSTERLNRCKSPMLLQFSVKNALDDPKPDVLIRSCTLDKDTSTTSSVVSTAQHIDSSQNTTVANPKKSTKYFEASLNTLAACGSTGTTGFEELGLKSSSDGGHGIQGERDSVLAGLQRFFEAQDNCDENFAFAYSGSTVASAYIGPGLGKSSMTSALTALFESDGANRTVAQLCSSSRGSEMSLGISIDTTGALVAVQQMAFEWSQGRCIDQKDLIPNTAVVFEVSDLANPRTVNGTLGHNTTGTSSPNRLTRRQKTAYNVRTLNQRATCRYTTVISGDGCDTLVTRCGISAADLTKFNPTPNLCSSLKVGDYICCSAGDPYTTPKPDPPKPGADGICATHLIENGDTCGALATKYGLTIAEIEIFNKGKTWAWTECKNMLLGYNLCLSTGIAPIPPPQVGSECGPLVPGTSESSYFFLEDLQNRYGVTTIGTIQPTDISISIADLNPCALKACCSNWGYCGVFPAHCDIHAPEGDGPGSKLDGFQNTYVSNCGNDIKQVSGPPSAFSRVGYYSAFNRERECLWLAAADANTDGSYTHIHWAFATIDASTWKPVITESVKGDWEAFKALKNVKRIVSLGGWAFSTEAATYNIIRQAIIDNRNLFATNLAEFVKTEGIDGIDIDWEYPGAPDILVNGSPIGKTTDGLDYLKFLTILKKDLGTASVSIAAPASYWYLKGFPIDRIAAIIDYIVYMTYDLHGQWDAGNPNAYDQCDSGRCIRSHVNLTETRNSLSIITKAGVSNNKVFVGEASYGRSFKMAIDGCWGPMCDFTGTRIQSDANLGRCTKTAGYLGNAEIDEIIARGGGKQSFHDAASNSDILLYNGDYVSYMTPTTKDTRRADWKDLNFAGSIDWALDLQAFTTTDVTTPPVIPDQGETGCVMGEDLSVNSGDLCEFACSLGFCPESVCVCTSEDFVNSLPTEKDNSKTMAMNEMGVDLNRLCLFACKYGYCPTDVCTTIPVDDVVMSDDDDPNIGFDYEGAREANSRRCLIYQDRSLRDYSVQRCYNTFKSQLDAAAEAGRTSNYGCMGFYPLDKAIPWEKPAGTHDVIASGECLCDSWILNEIADTIIEALPIIAQIGCYILMSSLKLVLDIGLEAIPVIGKPLDAGLDMATTAAQMASYLYPESEVPEDVFSWCLSPCGGSDLVPDDIKNIFDILSTVATGATSFKTPKNLPKGSGKKGDPANPTDRALPKPAGTGKGTKAACKIPASKQKERLAHTYREQSCVQDKTVMTEWIITTLTYTPNAVATQIARPCKSIWSQACYHYESAISKNPAWSTLPCPTEAAAPAKPTKDTPRKVVDLWESQHKGTNWRSAANRPQGVKCQADEYPPIYLLDQTNPIYLNTGSNINTNPGVYPGGQLVRHLPNTENQGAQTMWKGVCFKPLVAADELTDRKLKDTVDADTSMAKIDSMSKGKRISTRSGSLTVNKIPEFSVSSWPAMPPNAGLNVNPCWPQNISPADPGFTLLKFDPFYNTGIRPYDFSAPYNPPNNGA